MNDHGWLIKLEGAAEAVIPRGVHRPSVAGAEPIVLHSSVDDAYRNLDRVSRTTDDEEAAEALADHARSHPISRFLCHHGLPMWHRGADPCRMLMTTEGVPCVALSHVRTMMDGLRGLERLACHVATRTDPVRPAQVAAALQWAVLPEYVAKPARAETQRDGELFLGRCQQIVTLSMRSLHDASLLRRDIGWIEGSRPQLVTRADSDLGLYVHAFTAHLLRSAGAVDERPPRSAVQRRRSRKG